MAEDDTPQTSDQPTDINDLSIPYTERAQARDEQLGGFATDPAYATGATGGLPSKRVVVASSDDAAGTTINRTLGPDAASMPTHTQAEIDAAKAEDKS